MSKFSFPDKLNLALLPTPIRPMASLSRQVSPDGKQRIWVKRDDLTHGPAAGNKVRKLEYILAEAKRQGRTTVFTCGGVQSNHARATAILCREAGLRCVLFLVTPDGKAPAAGLTGNLLLDRYVGAETRFVTPGQYENMPKVFFDAAEEVREKEGRAPCLIPEGGSNEVGTLGYVEAFDEIFNQAGKNGLPDKFDSIVIANGSGGTHAGLLLGRYLRDINDDSWRIISFNVLRTAEQMTERVKKVMLATAQKNHMPVAILPRDIEVIDGYVGPGYAKAAPELYDFIANVAAEDGLLLDPAYTGKALYGLVSELRASPERGAKFGREILFIHTGGLPSLFAHTEQLADAITRRDQGKK